MPIRITPHSLFCPPHSMTPGNINLLPVSLVLPILNMSYKWSPKSHGHYLQAGDPGNPMGVVQSESKDLRTREVSGAIFRPRSREDQCFHSPRTEKANSFKSGRKANSSFLCLLVLVRPSVDWMMSTHTEKDNLSFTVFTVCNSNANLTWKHSHRLMQKCLAIYLGTLWSCQADT